MPPLGTWLAKLASPSTRHWLKIVGGAALLVLVIALVWYAASRVTPGVDPQATLLEEHKAKVDADLKALRDRNATMEAELVRLQEAFEALQEEVRLSIQQREEEHDAVDGASTIDDIDAVLRRGSSRRGEAQP